VRAQRHLLPTTLPPQSVAALAATLPAGQWYRRTVSEGTKGPIAYDFARHRVTLCKDGLPERTVGLVLKRTRGPEPTYAYAMSNAPASTPLRTLLWLSGMRWAVEQCCEEGKTERGMAHDEVRQYAGWQHHMLLTMLAHFFLWHLKGHLGEKSPSTDGVAAPPVIRRCIAPAYLDD
jgi:SRSO17 transposase